MAFNISYIISVTNKFSGPLKQMSAGMKGLAGHMKKAASAGGLVDKQFGRLKNTLKSHPLLTLGGAFLALRQALGTLLTFEGAMNRLSAVTMATTTEMSAMKKVAKELGRTTAYTSGQTAEAMTFLAQAGLNTQEVIEAIPGTLQLAAAGNMDLASAADIATNVLSAMGLKVSELTRVNDVLAKSQSISNTNVFEMAEAYKTSATIASGLGFEVELLSASIGLMANQGLKGSLAGTKLRRMLTNMSAPLDKARALYKKLGINIGDFVDKQGKITDFKGFIGNLSDLDKAGKLSVGTLKDLFGEQGFIAASVLIKSGSKELENFEKKLKLAGGTAKEMADRQMAGLVGAFKTLKSAFEGFTLSFMGSTETGGAIMLFMKALTGLLGVLTWVNERLSWILTPIYLFVAALVSLRIATVAYTFASRQLAASLAIVRTVMLATAAGTAVYTTAAAIATPVVVALSSAFKAMWIFATGPIGIAVIGIGLLITYAQYLKEKFGSWGPALEMAFAPILFLLKPLILISGLVAKIYRNWGKIDDKTLTIEHAGATATSRLRGAPEVDTQTSQANTESRWDKYKRQPVDVTVGGEIGVTATGGAAIVNNNINMRTGSAY